MMFHSTYFISSSIALPIDPRILISQAPFLRDDYPPVAYPYQGITALLYLTGIVFTIQVSVCYTYLHRMQEQLMKV